jgi:hypothetical protein
MNLGSQVVESGIEKNSQSITEAIDVVPLVTGGSHDGQLKRAYVCGHHGQEQP